MSQGPRWSVGQRAQCMGRRLQPQVWVRDSPWLMNASRAWLAQLKTTQVQGPVEADGPDPIRCPVLLGQGPSMALGSQGLQPAPSPTLASGLCRHGPLPRGLLVHLNGWMCPTLKTLLAPQACVTPVKPGGPQGLSQLPAAGGLRHIRGLSARRGARSGSWVHSSMHRQPRPCRSLSGLTPKLQRTPLEASPWLLRLFQAS